MSAVTNATLPLPAPAVMGSQVRRGFQWSFAVTLVQGAMQVGVTMTMARLLLPAEYGVYAMAEVVLRWATLFAQMGLATVLVQSQSLTESDLRGAHTLAVAFGSGAALVVAGVAPWVGAWFGNGEVVPLLRLAALSFAIGGLGLVSGAMLRRRMEFGRIGAAELGGYLLGNGVTAIWLARQGAGVWAVVIGSLVAQVIQTGLVIAQARIPFRFTARPAAFGRLMRQGSHVSANTCLDLINNTMDAVVVARVLPLPLIGLFNRAALLAGLPANFLWSAVSRVTFPSYARLQNDRPAFATFMRSVQGWSGTVMVAVPLGMIPAADVIVNVLLGSAWQGVVPIVQLLLLGVAFESLAIPYHTALDALGVYSARTRIRLIILVVRAAALTAAVVYNTPWLFYVAGFTAVSTWLISVRPLARALGTPARQMLLDDFGILGRAVCCTAMVGLARYLAQAWTLTPVATLVLCLVAGAGTLLFTLRRHLPRLGRTAS